MKIEGACHPMISECPFKYAVVSPPCYSSTNSCGWHSALFEIGLRGPREGIGCSGNAKQHITLKYWWQLWDTNLLPYDSIIIILHLSFYSSTSINNNNNSLINDGNDYLHGHPGQGHHVAKIQNSIYILQGPRVAKSQNSICRVTVIINTNTARSVSL